MTAALTAFKLEKFQKLAHVLLEALLLRRDEFKAAQREEFLIRYRDLEGALTRDLANGALKWYDRSVELEQLHIYWCGMGGASSQPGDPQWYPSSDWEVFINPPPEPSSHTEIIMSPSDDTVITDPNRISDQLGDPPATPWWPTQPDPDPVSTPPPAPTAALRRPA
jgi:hypothetical protein